MIKVSVVVPVFDNALDLRRCLDSLTRQSLPAEEYEVVVIDDGSTDESAVILDAASRRHPQIRVWHQANSGWPGQPRNKGLDLAQGEYVFFCDADDWLADHALELMYRFAVEHELDIVVGKMLGVGRAVPHVLFTRTRPLATFENAPLMDSLTPHKLFRREFLVSQGIRFPEGRRRLEDHVFVARAYCAARRIGVYSDEPCYFHTRRSDGGNISSQPPHWPSYFDDLTEAISIIEANLDPGPVRDNALVRWLRVEMVRRLSGRQFLRRDPEDARALFDAAHGVAVAHFGPGVIGRLQPAERPVARALLAGDYDELEAIAVMVTGQEDSARLAATASKETPRSRAQEIDRITRRLAGSVTRSLRSRTRRGGRPVGGGGGAPGHVRE
jgi:glycosyltransferase involved in cell wall biosynthesis